MFDWSDTVFRRRNVTRRRISNTVLQPRYWGREANSPEVYRLSSVYEKSFCMLSEYYSLHWNTYADQSWNGKLFLKHLIKLQDT
jgi:hypothetical protein